MKGTAPAYFENFARRTWWTWLWSGLVAGVINAALFVLMPYLINSAPGPASVERLVSQVNVIRMKRPETPVKRKTPKPPPTPEPKPAQKPRATPREPVMTKLTLPFEVNPRLPGGPHTLVLPDLESAPLAPAVGMPGEFHAGQLDDPLTVLTRIPPIYPMGARRRGIEGWVKVQFIVDEGGHVGDIEILDAQPPEIFNQSVHRCVSGWRFKPGTVEGIAVRARVETTIRFELE